MNYLNKLLYMPIEIESRELDYKLAVALKAIKQGVSVAIGNMDDDFTEYLLPGVIFYKDHGVQSETRYALWKERGWGIIALDDEGLLYHSDEVYIRSRISKKCMNLADKVLCWGDVQYRLFSSSYKRKLTIVGHPRFELFRPPGGRHTFSWPAKKILINTRFASIHPIRSKENEKAVRIKLNVIKEEELSDYENFLENEKKIFDEFVRFIDLLIGSGSDVQLTIRPHPVEDQSPYIKIAKGNQNIVISRSSLLEDIEKCDVMIHDGSTTGIEARHFGVPVFCLRPCLNGSVYTDFSNKFGFEFQSASTLYDALFNEDYKFSAHLSDTDIARYIANWKDNSASSKIASEICALLGEDKFIDRDRQGYFLKKPSIFSTEKFKRFFKDAIIFFMANRITKSKSEAWFIRSLKSRILSKKKYSLTNEKIVSRLNYISELYGVNVQYFCREVYPGVFLIMPAAEPIDLSHSR